MANPEHGKKIHHVEVKECNYVIIGDGTTINLSGSKGSSADQKDVIDILSTLNTLPGKPFHECFLRVRAVEEIESLYESMSNSKELRLSTIYLTGPPGSGKTQIARQFGEKFLESTPSYENYPPLVLTLNVDSFPSLLKSTKELLEKLGFAEISIITKDDGERDLVKMHMEQLRKLLGKYPGKWLLILDNMFRDQDIGSILPMPGSQDWGEGKVIVTTQDNDLVPSCHTNARKYSLESGMDEIDALTLLSKISGINKDEFAVELAKELEYFPLSLACSATYVKQMKDDRPSCDFSWKQFLTLYRNQKESLTYRTYVAFNVYPYSMIVAARMAAKRLAECSEVLRHTFDFLSYCTLSPVPLVIVSSFVQSKLPSSPIPRDEVMAEICRCSLLLSVVSELQSVESIKFHQVMSEAFKYIRDEPHFTSNLDDEEEKKKYVVMLKSLNDGLHAAIPNYDRCSVALKVLTSPHLKAFVSHGNSKSWNTSAEFVVVLAYLADCLYHVPGVTEAERIMYIEQAHRTAKSLPSGMMGIRYCQILKSLGFFYREANHLDESVTVLTEALALAEGKRGNAWLALKSSILNVLSWSYKLQMKLDLAEETMKQSIEVTKQAFGEHHEEIVERLCNLAIIHREKYQMKKARETVDEARRIAEISTDEWHLNRALAANSSAKVYLRCAEITDNTEEKHELLKTSLRLHAEALKIYENVLGENHIYIAGVCMTYAMVYKELKAYAQAIQEVERSVKIYSDAEHVQLSAALRYKTEVLIAMGNVSEEAERVINKSIELSNCGRGRFLLAHVYLQQKRYTEARVILKEVLSRWKSGVLPKTHFWIKHAEQLKAESDWGSLKEYSLGILFVVVVLFSIVLSFLMNS